MASITMAESVAFLPVVYANCWIGWMDWSSSRSFQPFRLVPVQSPYARLTCAVPYFATSASSPSTIAGQALSESISTASLAAFSLATPSKLPSPVRQPARGALHVRAVAGHADVAGEVDAGPERPGDRVVVDPRRRPPVVGR